LTLRTASLLSLAISFALVACATTESPADDFQLAVSGCTQADIRLENEGAPETEDVCSAAKEVFEFFRALGLTEMAPITLSIVDEFPAELGVKVLGCFFAKDMHIKLLSRARASAIGTWLDRPLDRKLYKSLASHEIAHALTHCNARGASLSARAQEYVAYVAMFVTMDPEHKAAILAANPDASFETEEQISDTHYYLAPYKFGVAVYRHYLLPGNGNRFLMLILCARQRASRPGRLA
jgi:hypothetical protein